MNKKLKRDCVPLTQAQIGLYMDWSENPSSMKYNVPTLCRLPHGTDKSRFIDAVKTVVSHHPALFAVCRTVQGVPSMVYRNQEIVFEEKTADTIEAGTKDLCRPFDLENGPLFRFIYLSTKEGDAFFFDIHHIVMDGASHNIFIPQIAAVYGGEKCSDEEPTFFDIAFDEAGKDDPERMQRFRDMLATKLDGLECDSRPISDVVAGDGENKMGAVLLSADENGFTDAVDAYIKAHKLTENALFQAAFGYTLAKFNGAKESVYTTAFHGRTKSAATAVGMFVRTLPMHCTFDENSAPAELIKTMSDFFYEMKQND